MLQKDTNRAGRNGTHGIKCGADITRGGALGTKKYNMLLVQTTLGKWDEGL